MRPRLVISVQLLMYSCPHDKNPLMFRGLCLQNLIDVHKAVHSPVHNCSCDLEWQGNIGPAATVSGKLVLSLQKQSCFCEEIQLQLMSMGVHILSEVLRGLWLNSKANFQTISTVQILSCVYNSSGF